MRFGIKKCGTIKLQRGIEDYRRNVLPNAQVIQNDKHGGYKYLEALEADQIKQDEMKDTIRTEYFRRVKRLLGSKMISAINTWAGAGNNVRTN